MLIFITRVFSGIDYAAQVPLNTSSTQTEKSQKTENADRKNIKCRQNVYDFLHLTISKRIFGRFFGFPPHFFWISFSLISHHNPYIFMLAL